MWYRSFQQPPMLYTQVTNIVPTINYKQQQQKQQKCKEYTQHRDSSVKLVRILWGKVVNLKIWIYHLSLDTLGQIIFLPPDTIICVYIYYLSWTDRMAKKEEVAENIFQLLWLISITSSFNSVEKYIDGRNFWQLTQLYLIFVGSIFHLQLNKSLNYGSKNSNYRGKRGYNFINFFLIFCFIFLKALWFGKIPRDIFPEPYHYWMN